MPRLLPRLVKWLERNPPSQPDYRGPLCELRKRRPRSLWKPTPSVNELSELFAVQNRNRSVLLEDVNVISKRGDTERHKSLPPVVRLQEPQKGRIVDQDSPRGMTEQEKQWWSSPYLRMLSSPIRNCILSWKLMPSDVLVRFVAVRLPPKRRLRSSTVLVPSGILHPRFSTRIHGIVYYLSCWKDALEEAMKRNKHKRPIAAVTVHSLLAKQVSHQLRLRVLQELEMLALRLKAAPRELSDEAVIRRLTRSEWSLMKSTGKVPWEGAACVIVAPPVNRDPQTKQRPQPNYDNIPPESLDDDSGTNKKTLPPLPPVSTFYPVQDSPYEEPLDFLEDSHVPHPSVPVYNGLSLFPSKPQRAALHKRLCEILDIESRVRWKQKKRADEKLRNEKPSHAFVVFSNAKTVARADTVPLAVALWRIRLWEGEGWDDCHWALRRPPQTYLL